jgi:AraC-like DNA-binding protein
MTRNVTGRGRPLHSEERVAVAPPPVLLALVLGAEERYRIRDATRQRAHVCFVERAADLLIHVAADARPLAGIVVEAIDRDSRSVAETVRELRMRIPEVPVVGYCRIGYEHSAGIRSLAAAGVHELIFHNVDDHGVALRAVLDAGAQACAAEVVLAEVAPLVADTLHPFMAFCLRHPHKAHTVTEVASALGLNRKTFANYSQRAQTLIPAELLAWCRLLLSAYYLTHTSRTVESIALQLDFPSDTALRNMMKRYTGHRAQEVRAKGGLPCVIACMAAAVNAHRMGTRQAAST